MRTDFDSEPNDPLVDAALRDGPWQAASAVYKTEALGALRRRRRQRRLARWTGGVVAVVALLAALEHWFARPAAAPRQLTMVRPPPPKTAPRPQRLTDAQLIAAFPRGSCFIAEVDGKKELVFLDPNVERAYLARSSMVAR